MAVRDTVELRERGVRIQSQAGVIRRRRRRYTKRLWVQYCQKSIGAGRVMCYVGGYVYAFLCAMRMFDVFLFSILCFRLHSGQVINIMLS